MATPDTSSKSGASFFWVVGAFFGFAVLLYALQWIAGNPESADPRMNDRLTIKSDILKAQNEIVEKTGLNDESKREALFAASAKALSAQKAKKSDVVVPGSPTQIKQAAASAPVPEAAPSSAEPAPAAVEAPAN